MNALGGTHDAMHWRSSAIHVTMQTRNVLAIPTVTLELGKQSNHTYWQIQAIPPLPC